jgi:hypothetical protein
MIIRVIEERPGEFDLVIGGLREVDILNLNADGSVVLSKKFEIPRRSGSGRRQALTLQSTAQISESGLIGLVASDNGLLSFDARDGEIVGEEELDLTPVSSIRLIQPRNLLLVARGDNRLLLRDFTPSPRIDSVRISKKSTTIRGSLFLSGARVVLNGVDLGVSNRNPDNPGSEIVLARRKKDFPKGQDFTVTVVNRDGLASPPVTFRR